MYHFSYYITYYSDKAKLRLTVLRLIFTQIKTIQHAKYFITFRCYATLLYTKVLANHNTRHCVLVVENLQIVFMVTVLYFRISASYVSMQIQTSWAMVIGLISVCTHKIIPQHRFRCQEYQMTSHPALSAGRHWR